MSVCDSSGQQLAPDEWDASGMDSLTPELTHGATDRATLQRLLADGSLLQVLQRAVMRDHTLPLDGRISLMGLLLDMQDAITGDGAP